MSCDSLDDVSIPSPDSEMSQGTLTTAPIGVSYNEAGNVGIGTVNPLAILDVKGSIRANTAVSSLPISLPPGGGMSNYVFGFPSINTWTTIFSAPGTSLFAFWIKIGQSDNTTSSGIFGIIPRHSYFDNTIYKYGHNTGYVQMSGGSFQAYYSSNSGGYGNVAYLTIMRIV